MTPSDRPTHIAFLLLEEFTHLAFSCAIEPLRIANHVSERALYRWTLLSSDGQKAVCSNGSATLVDAGLSPLEKTDHLFVKVAAFPGTLHRFDQ